MTKPPQNLYIDRTIVALNDYSLALMNDADHKSAGVELGRQSAKAVTRCYKVFSEIQQDGRFELVHILDQAKTRLINKISKGIASEFIKDALRERDFTKAFEQCWHSLQDNDEPGI